MMNDLVKKLFLIQQSLYEASFDYKYSKIYIPMPQTGKFQSAMPTL